MGSGERSEFAEQFAAIRQAAPDSTRFVLVTATVPEETYEQLSRTAFPGMKVAFGPRLHRPSSGALERPALSPIPAWREQGFCAPGGGALAAAALRGWRASPEP